MLCVALSVLCVKQHRLACASCVNAVMAFASRFVSRKKGDSLWWSQCTASMLTFCAHYGPMYACVTCQMLIACWLCLIVQARLAALKREEEWLHKEQERLEAEKAEHIRQLSCCMSVHCYQSEA